MQTIASVLALHEQLIHSDSSRLDCELLLSAVLDKDRAYLYAWPEKELTLNHYQQYYSLFERRRQGEPIAYILGEKEFWSLSLAVNASTLIPRPDTECLVELALSLGETDELKSVLDLGTGTGAIALAIASECPSWQVSAVDKHSNALSLAQKNAQTLGLGRVKFYLSDWFDCLDEKRFDIIVSNPPYIDRDDPHLNQGDVVFEPVSALVAADHGFKDIVQIISNAPTYLSDRGWLLIEHGYQQAERVRQLLSDQGFSNVCTHNDLAHLPRVSMGQYVHK